MKPFVPLRTAMALVFFSAFCVTAGEGQPIFRAGAFAIDITPTNYPVIVNAMFFERTATNAHDRLHARCLVLDDGTNRIAIAVVDTCMMPRDLIDEAKERASEATGIPTDRMLISATHTHSAPSAMGCLGSRADTNYARFLPGRIAEGIARAAKNLAPARVGWAVAQDYEHTHCRRWIRRPDRIEVDPFGERTVRANMHPGHESKDAIGPAGPVDPDLSVFSIQTPDGRPVALLANYSMHYYESPLLSADYYGVFAEKIAKLLGVDNGSGPFVVIMSQGTSGDLAWMDYSKPRKHIGLDAYAAEVAQVAYRAYTNIQYHDSAPLVMREKKLTLGFRLCDEKRLEWAKQVVASMGDRLPRTLPEVYAKEQLYLRQRPTAELKLQALRIGDLGITAIPNEVFALTGLKIKAQSPLVPTFNIELANGAEGYVPPPEQHKLGGYTTWAARTAGLVPEAEPQIVETVLSLLEEVASLPRRKLSDVSTTYSRLLLDAQPVAYWRGPEFSGPLALDSTARHHHARYEDGVVFRLDGPNHAGVLPTLDTPHGSDNNPCPHFAGGRLAATLTNLPLGYSVEFWFWNGLPNDARAVTGYFFSRGADGDSDANGDHLGIAGTHDTPGLLLFYNGNQRRQTLVGHTRLDVKTWHHVVLVRDALRVTAYLDGNPKPEFIGTADITFPTGPASLFFGGRSDNFANFEGKLDEIAVFDRPLSAQEATAHYKAARSSTKVSVAQPESSALSPKDSLDTFHLPDGFRAELVASEPLLQSPVAFDWGADGKLWVVEMADYPMGMDGKMKAGGRVRVLEDTDGDGRFDKSSLFLTNLNFPNGIITWRKGVIVTAAPDILYAEDTDGDGRADKRQVLYTGFKEGNLQLRVNGLRFGLDNWLHCANGWSGGKPRSVKTGATADLSGRDLRIQPDTGALETLSGQSEFGRNRDDWGNWFGCDNSNPLFHFVIEEHYLRRNPHVPAPDVKKQLFTPNPKVYAISKVQKRYHSFEHADHFTSGCSTDFYRDELLFARGAVEHAFICEPVHNLIQHELVEEEGASFKGRQARDLPDRDFLVSSDQWFRPVMIRTGPDGALWVADMYRYMIEHPDWLPPEGKKEMEPFYRLGEERGRIYRIVRDGAKTRPVPRFNRMNVKELIATLENPNGWQRDQAQMQLLWRGDTSAVGPLEALVRKSASPLARLHALCTLDGLSALRIELAQQALRDSHPSVRLHALRISERFTSVTSTNEAVEPSSLSPSEGVRAGVRGLFDDITALLSDPDPKVRLQLACTLGEWHDPRADASLGQVATQDLSDKYLLAAVISSAPPHSHELVKAAIAAGPTALDALTEPLLTLSFALTNHSDMGELLTWLLLPRAGHSRLGNLQYSAPQYRIFASFLDMLSRRGTSLEKLAASADSTLAQRLSSGQAIFTFARHTATDDTQPLDTRVSATALLGREPDQRRQDLRQLSALLVPSVPGELQRAAVKALAASGDDAIASILLTNWSAALPNTRAGILDALIPRDKWALELLHTLENAQITSQDIDAARRNRLLKHRSAPVKALAEKVFAASASSDRQKVLDQFRPALDLFGDASHGKVLFAKLCATCHRIGDTGRDLGPNLISVRGHSPEKLLTSILDPNREVEPRYLAYNCVLTGGEELYGLIAGESGTSIELKLPDGSTRSVLRSEIAQLRGTKLSLMPEGLESGLSAQDMADLIRYLREPDGP
jgi:putative membrane-bound dehydrogenase-like protein